MTDPTAKPQQVFFLQFSQATTTLKNRKMQWLYGEAARSVSLF